jgi:hypothetical protein
MHLSIKSLASTLRISKYCRQVILGSAQLRRTMLLEPAPATEWVIWQICWYRCSLWRIVRDPVEDSSIIIKMHPSLRSLIYPVQKLAGYVISGRQVEAAAPNTLLFQPPPPSVTVSDVDNSRTRTHFWCRRCRGRRFARKVSEENQRNCEATMHPRQPQRVRENHGGTRRPTS